jgi:hypothetical protein
MFGAQNSLVRRSCRSRLIVVSRPGCAYFQDNPPPPHRVEPQQFISNNLMSLGRHSLRLFLPIILVEAALFAIVPAASAQHWFPASAPVLSSPLFPSPQFDSSQPPDASCLVPQNQDPEKQTPQNQQQTQPPAKPAQPGTASGSGQAASNSGQQAAPPGTAQPPQQPKRILGVMPNFRAVSAGELPPPPTPKQAFIIATQNSFDYSSFIFVGFTSALAEWTDAHPQLGQGMPGFGRYYWRGFVDKTDGNYLVIFALPTLFHEDERYYAMGKGSFWKRAVYSSTRMFVTPDYHGRNTFNLAEILGRAISQGISVTYYPSQTRTPGAVAEKFGYALGRDALTNVFREFWPDISVHVLHRQP